MSEARRQDDLVQKLMWLTKVKLLLIVGATILGFLLHEVAFFNFPLYPVAILFGLASVYNLFWYLILRKENSFKWFKKQPARLSALAHASLYLELIGFTFFVWVTGTTESPLTFTYLFYPIIATILFSSRVGQLLAGFISVSFGTLSYLEYLKVVPHWVFADRTHPELFQNTRFTLEQVVVLVGTLHLSVYLTSYLTNRIREREARLEFLNQMGMALVKSGNTSKLVASTTKILKEFPLFDSYGLFLADSGKNSLYPVSISGSISKHLKIAGDGNSVKGKRIVNFAQRVFKDKKELLIPGENLLFLPLVYQRKALGVFVCKRAKSNFNQKQVELLRAALHQISIALNNIELSENLKELLEETTALYEASQLSATSLEIESFLKMVLESAVKTVSADYGSIMLLDEERKELKIAVSRDLGLKAIRQKEILSEFSKEILKDEDIFWQVANKGKPASLNIYSDKHAKDFLEKWNFSSVLVVPLIVRDKVIGVMNAFYRDGEEKKDTKVGYRERNLEFFSTLAGQVAVSIQNAKLFSDLGQLYVDTVKAFVATIEAKDPYTRGHSENIMRLASALGRDLQLSSQELKTLETAALLHDIGKIGVPEKVLNKRGRLSPSEFSVVQKHPLIGQEIIGQIPGLKDIEAIISAHHEYFNGQGYHSNLKGSKIPLESRILAVVDAFDAMTSHRPYRHAYSVEEALDELEAKAGTQFDPEIVDSFCQLIKDNPALTAPV